jgi:hypothetical protein
VVVKELLAESDAGSKDLVAELRRRYQTSGPAPAHRYALVEYHFTGTYVVTVHPCPQDAMAWHTGRSIIDEWLALGLVDLSTGARYRATLSDHNDNEFIVGWDGLEV